MKNPDTDRDDDRLLDELRRLFQQADPMPSWLNEAARRIYTTRPVGRRSAGPPRDARPNESIVNQEPRAGGSSPDGRT